MLHYFVPMEKNTAETPANNVKRMAPTLAASQVSASLAWSPLRVGPKQLQLVAGQLRAQDTHRFSGDVVVDLNSQLSCLADCALSCILAQELAFRASLIILGRMG